MDILNGLKKLTDEKNILTDEPLKKHTSFKIGGNADYLVIPKTKEEVISVIAFLKEEKIPYFIMGNGSNLLVNDEGYRGVVVKFAGGLKDIKVDGDRMYVEAGAIMSKISSVCLKNSLDGFCELSGIPGTFGGAVYMNAGAYGREIKDILIDVTFIDEDGEIKTITANEAQLSYRSSIFAGSGKVILWGNIQLEKGNSEEILNKTREVAKKRNDKQPLNYPSAGSTFKRPEGYFAAKLIEDCGFKGVSVGGAKVSEKHSGFVINYDNATFEDVIKLTDHIKKEVKEKFDVELELEVKIV